MFEDLVSERHAHTALLLLNILLIFHIVDIIWNESWMLIRTDIFNYVIISQFVYIPWHFYHPCST